MERELGHLLILLSLFDSYDQSISYGDKLGDQHPRQYCLMENHKGNVKQLLTQQHQDLLQDARHFYQLSRAKILSIHQLKSLDQEAKAL